MKPLAFKSDLNTKLHFYKPIFKMGKMGAHVTYVFTALTTWVTEVYLAHTHSMESSKRLPENCGKN